MPSQSHFAVVIHHICNCTYLLVKLKYGASWESKPFLGKLNISACATIKDKNNGQAHGNCNYHHQHLPVYVILINGMI